MNPMLVKTFDNTIQRDEFLRTQCPNRMVIEEMPGYFRLPDGLVVHVSDTVVVFLK